MTRPGDLQNRPPGFLFVRACAAAAAWLRTINRADVMNVGPARDRKHVLSTWGRAKLCACGGHSPPQGAQHAKG